MPRRAAGAGVALRDRRGVNDPDHLLFVDGRACGILEAKTVGRTLTGVEGHSKRYREPVPGGIPTWGLPLFAYESTGVEAR